MSLGQRILGSTGPQLGVLDLYEGQQPMLISEGKLADSDCGVPFVLLATERTTSDPTPTRQRLQNLLAAYRGELDGTFEEEVDGALRYFGFSEWDSMRASQLLAYVQRKGLTSARVLCAVSRKQLLR